MEDVRFEFLVLLLIDWFMMRLFSERTHTLPHCVSRLANVVINPWGCLRLNWNWVFDRLIILRYKTYMQMKTTIN